MLVCKAVQKTTERIVWSHGVVCFTRRDLQIPFIRHVQIRYVQCNIIIVDAANHPAPQRCAKFTTNAFLPPMAPTRANALATAAAQSRMAQRHYRRSDDRYTSWLETATHVSNLRILFYRQLHALATSTSVFGDSYALCGNNLHLHFRQRSTHTHTHLVTVFAVGHSPLVHSEMDEGNARRLSRQQRLKCLNICSKTHASQQLQNGGGKPVCGWYHANDHGSRNQESGQREQLLSRYKSVRPQTHPPISLASLASVEKWAR